MVKSVLTSLLVAFLVISLRPGLASAQEPPRFPAWVATSAPVPLLVDGLETDKLPVAIGLGSEVCVVSAQHYTAEAERWTFQRWSGPGLSRAESSGVECIAVAQPGVYRAFYAREVLLHVRSSAPGLQLSAWVPYGAPTDVQVPQLVQEGDRVRYRFLEWSDGETRFLPANRIALLKPTTLEAKFGKEYLIRVEGSAGVEVAGTGWYADGTSVVLQAPDAAPVADGQERLQFARWETVGTPGFVVPDAGKPSLIVKADAPYTLRAAYDKQFLVIVQNPTGTVKREWIAEEGRVELEIPPVIEIAPGQERLLFQRWEGQEGLLVTKIAGTVNGPLSLRAVYVRQFRVTVEAPHSSSGGGWYKQGATATVTVPSAVENWFFFQDVFVGFAGYGKSPTMSLVVGEPVDLTALYRREVNLKVLALMGILPLAVAGLLVGDWRLRRRLGLAPRRRSVE